ncbi:endonuclease domain-containing protein [Bradyrhizobium oligotrophicum]|uniref:endonuclease domain-containing protein n=1 Tax=Bradyrhizobium oligotrophicum TaxID=44255 RepID=UPI003EC0E4BF
MNNTSGGPPPEWIRKTLLDDDEFSSIFHFFVRKMKEEEAQDDSASDQFNIFFAEAVTALAAENKLAVQHHVRSPIEKLFLHSFILDSIKSRHLISVHWSYGDCEIDVARLRQDLTRFRELEAWFEKERPCKTLDLFLDQELARGKMSKDEREYMNRLVLKYRYLPLADEFHVTLQPKFKTITVDGSSIRPDIFFWIPNRPETKIIVECDGYEFHSSRDRFTNDRKRDRALKSLGYDVLRFSGREIHKDPVAVAAELADYLIQVGRKNE